jgi:hypothetical protein
MVLYPTLVEAFFLVDVIHWRIIMGHALYQCDPKKAMDRKRKAFVSHYTTAAGDHG